ncbi:MAG: hypothetical protein ABFQ62_03395 [Patescibacteria group bacterium]
MNKKILSTSILFLILIFNPFWQNTKAQDVYTEQDREASPSTETTKNLKDRIQRVVKEREEEIKGVIEDLSQKRQGFIGEVERVSGETLSIKTIKDTRIIAVDDTVSLLKNNKKIELKDVSVGDWLIVMGMLEDDNFVAKRILVSSESLRPRNHTVVLGSISEIAKKSLTFQARSESDSKTLMLNSSSSYQDFEGNKIAKSDLGDELQALVIYYEQDDDEQSNKIVTVIRALSALEPDED